MKFTLGWLKTHLDTQADLATIAARLTDLGLEVEGVVDPGAAFAPFRTARVIEAVQHPNAERLRLCRVETAEGEVQVVCGAPNARTGLVGIFAPVGSTVPGTGLLLKTTEIRGVASNGMLCSEKEMGLSDDHEGIIELDPATPVGVAFAQIFGRDDPVIEIKLTPDRGDCAGVHGIARDLAASGLGTLVTPPVAPVPGQYDSPIGVERQLSAEHQTACPLFIGRHFRGVRNGPSPRWLADRLRAVGLNPISALVDITNFLSLDRARPLHVFDARHITGGIVVRMASAGESLVALDGRSYDLDDQTLVIADQARALGIGGIMGGLASGVQDDTTEVFLECALFDPRRVARSGRRLSISSDARYRFERGVDPAFAQAGMELASRLILELCGGEASHPVISGQAPDTTRTITLRTARVRDLGGVEVAAARQRQILTALGASVEDGLGGPGDTLTVRTPSWRHDLEGEADLVEEVLRIEGYDRIPATMMPDDAEVPRPEPTRTTARMIRARRCLAQRGYLEAVTWAFTSDVAAAAFGGAAESLRLLNPIIDTLQIMRPSLLPNLAQAAQRNADRGHGDVSLAEAGMVFGDGLPGRQQPVAAGLRAGYRVPRHWAVRAALWDVYDVKADALAVLAACGGPADKAQLTLDAPAWYHPGRSGVLRLGATVLAQFGELHPMALSAIGVDLGARGRPCGFELFLDAIPVPKKATGAQRPRLTLSPFQPVRRDFAFLVAADLPAERLVRAVLGADKALIESAEVFDVYSGSGVPAGQRSIALAVTLQPRQATLTEAEIEAIAGRIVAAAARHTGATLRS